MLAENLERVRQRVARACQRSGRDPARVTLIGVTKTIPVAAIRQAVALGLTEIGENRVQEAAAKRAQLEAAFRVEGSGLGALAQNPEPRTPNVPRLRWHLVGHLQSNKVKAAVELFDVIHSVDSLKLVEELERQAAVQGRELRVLIQVNVSREATKFGCRPEEARALAQAVLQAPHVRFQGLMTLAPYAEDPEAARPHFRALRQLRDEVAAACRLEPAACSLSMGMSGDFDVAIEEGADMVRIGTAIFGTRP